MVKSLWLNRKNIIIPEPVPEQPQDQIVECHGAEAREAGRDFAHAQGDEPERDGQQDDQREEIG